jgi:hypothetical protein
MRDKEGKIYGITDPRYFNLIRYIGQTTTSFKERMRHHMRSIFMCSKNEFRGRWVKKLVSLGFKPKMVPLEYNIPVPFLCWLQIDNKFKPEYDYDKLDKEEKYFITITRDECANLGIKCVNMTDGGGGRPGLPPWNKGLTKEIDSRLMLAGKKISLLPSKSKGKKFSEERKREMSKRNKGQKSWSKGLNKNNCDSIKRQCEHFIQNMLLKRNTGDKKLKDNIAKHFGGGPIPNANFVHRTFNVSRRRATRVVNELLANKQYTITRSD